MDQVKFTAEFNGSPINKEGIIKLKLLAPQSETAAVARLLMSWTKPAQVRMQTKKRDVSAEFTVSAINFKPDGTCQVVLESDTRGLPVNEIAAMNQKSISVTVG